MIAVSAVPGLPGASQSPPVTQLPLTPAFQWKVLAMDVAPYRCNAHAEPWGDGLPYATGPAPQRYRPSPAKGKSLDAMSAAVRRYRDSQSVPSASVIRVSGAPT